MIILILISLGIFYLGMRWGIYLEKKIVEIAQQMKERHG